MFHETNKMRSDTQIMIYDIICGVACPPPGYLPYPRIKPRSPALQADSLPSELDSKYTEVSYLWFMSSDPWKGMATHSSILA